MQYMSYTRATHVNVILKPPNLDFYHFINYYIPVLMISVAPFSTCRENFRKHIIYACYSREGGWGDKSIRWILALSYCHTCVV